MSWMVLMGQKTLNWMTKTKSKFPLVISLMVGCCLMRWRKLEMRKLLSIPHRLLQVIGAGLLILELAGQIDLALV
jgi:hypothetical protein